ncbi:MAG: hypothetical protein ACRAVC_15940 [Trichormus sp.]
MRPPNEPDPNDPRNLLILGAIFILGTGLTLAPEPSSISTVVGLSLLALCFKGR